VLFGIVACSPTFTRIAAGARGVASEPADIPSVRGGSSISSYEQGTPEIFVSNFSLVKKDLCQTCHTSGMARQDCLLCHKYHVNGVIAMSTRIPTE
jgi:hypothetical protein